MAILKTKKGLDLKLAGAPAPDIVDARHSATVAVYPGEFEGIKPRLHVQEGDTVRKGSVLFFHKQNPDLKFRAPAGGTVEKVTLGERRSLKEIRIKVDANAGQEEFKKFSSDQIPALSRDEVLGHLVDTGYIALIRQRPFSKMANPAVSPKSIFVNAMNTAPFQPDFNVVVKGDEAAFQAGLDLLGRLTDGTVHLCVDGKDRTLSPVLGSAKNVELHKVTGPHPAGNSSVHIHHLDPISPGQHVWVVKAVDVILLGKLFLNGSLPDTRVIAVGGPGVAEDARKYYRIQQGAELSSVLNGSLAEGDQRVIGGDVLSGASIDPNGYLRFYDSSINVLPESEERHFMGWLAPGLGRYSQSPLYLSKWFLGGKLWNLNTNKNGSHRAMVLTGIYDRFVPMRIMTDYLLRAVLAHDTDEAVELGLLEVDPEDFALCAFVCPSKTDVVAAIRRGLKELEEEGI